MTCVCFYSLLMAINERVLDYMNNNLVRYVYGG